jgi:crotonobetainyl-CoA:carnitine CoA-transferase CaiB-like acyl-CoA transferase
MLALEGLHVLDAASMMAGPYGATLLGDLGADVVKLEPPHGDETRRIGPRTETDSGVFVGLNRNKRSVAVDLRSSQGRAVLDALVDWADVVVDNMRPRVKQSLGLDWDSLHGRNPRVVSVSVSTFGASGPYAGRPGIDPIAQALSGLMNVTGFPDGDPVKAGPPVGDAVCSLLVAVGALSALWARQTTGEGQHVDVALIDGLVHIQGPYTGQFFLLGRQQPRMGNSTDWYAPYNAYRCADGGFLHLACYNDKFFGNLCEAIGRPDLADDERFRTNDARLANRARLDEAISAYLSTRSRRAALDELWAHDVIVGPVNDYEQVFSDPQVRHNAMVVETDHHTGPLPVTGVPLRLSATPGAIRRPPPALGEHTAEVLQELGLDAELVRGQPGGVR